MVETIVTNSGSYINREI